jgi:chromobox protein 5
MARVEAVDSDSDGHATTKTKKKAASSKDNKGSPEVDEVQNEADAASDEDEEAESEYEIEEIIDAKRGTFPGVGILILIAQKRVIFELFVLHSIGQTWVPREMERI